MPTGTAQRRQGAGDVVLGTAPGRWLLLVTVLGSALGFLEITVVNVALPRIGDDLEADVADLQWVLNGYLLTLSALTLLGGSLGDRLGRRRVFTVGVASFTAASLLCAMAPSVALLVAARVAQGVGGALMMPGSLAIIDATFRREDRGRAIGAWSGLTGLAAAGGPVLGGYLVDAVSWRAVFLVIVPLGAVVVGLALRHIPESAGEGADEPLDVAGAVLATVGLGSVTFGLIEAAERGVGAPLVVAALGAGAATLVVFALVERRARSPMLPLDIFRDRQFAAANLVTFVVYAALAGVLFLLSVFLQGALRYSPFEAGLATFPITALLLALSPRMGAFAQRVGPRVPLTAGPVLLAAGMLLMRTIAPGESYLRAVLPAVVVFGLGLSGVVAPVTATVLAAAPGARSGTASGINNAVARVAQLLAVAILPLAGGLAGDDYRRPAALAEGFRAAMLVAAFLALVGALVAATTISSDALDDAP